MKIISIAALLTAPAAATTTLYEIKEWGTTAVSCMSCEDARSALDR